MPETVPVPAATIAPRSSRTRVLDAKLVLSVRRITRSQRRGDYIDALTRLFSDQLTRIPLPIECDVDTAQAFRDASREEIMLNGVCFIGDHRTDAFVAAVKRIVAQHVNDSKACLIVTDRIMRGCSRTLSGSESYFALDELFSCPELLVGVHTRIHAHFLPNLREIVELLLMLLLPPSFGVLETDQTTRSYAGATGCDFGTRLHGSVPYLDCAL